MVLTDLVCTTYRHPDIIRRRIKTIRIGRQKMDFCSVGFPINQNFISINIIKKTNQNILSPYLHTKYNIQAVL